MTRVGYIVLVLLLAHCFATPVKRNAQIAFGTTAARGEFPSFVAVTDRQGNQFCGGTLIHPQYVLTAAHCTVETTASATAVILDRINLNTNSGQQINVAQIINHPNYDPSTTNNDIAILRLSTAVSQSQYVKYGDVHSSTTALAVGTLLWVVGYGLTEGGVETSVLRKVQVPIAQSTRCSQFSTFFTNTMLCAGDGRRDACPGDSGGPLGFFFNNTFYVAGVVSWGPDTTCGTTGNYGAYARVSTYVPWIRTIVPAWSQTTPTNPTTGGGTSGGGTTGGGTTGGGTSSNSTSTGGGSTGGSTSGGTTTGGGSTTSNSTSNPSTPGKGTIWFSSSSSISLSFLVALYSLLLLLVMM